MIDPSEIVAARQALGRLLAKYRKAAGLNQHQLAPRVHYGRSTIANVETGRQNVPRDFWVRCDQEFNAGGRLVAASERLDALVRRQREETAGLADAEQDDGATPSSDHDGLVTAAVDDDAFELADALGHSNIAPHVLDLLESSVIRVAQTYSTVPPPSLFEWGRTRLAAVVTLLRGSQPVVQRRRLCSIAGQLAGLRAWLAHDMHEPVSATSFYRVAATAAREAEDEALYAWVLGNHSRIPSYEGKPRAALTLIEEARERAEGYASPVARAWLLAQASRAYSVLNDHAAGGRALVQAERTLDAASTDAIDEIVYFDGGRLAAFVGHHHLLAGRPAVAEEQLRASLSRLKPEQIKHLVLTRLDLASALIAQGELAEACEQATAALTIPAEQMIDLTVQRARRLRGQVAANGGRFAPAREVVELIDSL